MAEEEKKISPKEIERCEKLYPETFSILSEMLPKEVIAKGCIALEHESQDHLFAMVLYHSALEAVASAMAIKAGIESLSSQEPAFSGLDGLPAGKKKHEA